MKITVLNPEELCRMYCQYFNVEMPEEVAAVPGALSVDEVRVLEDFAYLREAQTTEDKLKRFAHILNETEPSKRCRRAYEMVMNACGEADKKILAKNAGLVSEGIFIDMIRARAEREEYEETAQREGFSFDDYLQMAAVFAKKENFTEVEKAALARSKAENTALSAIAVAIRAAEELAENQRRDIIEEGKSFYAEKMEEYDQAASSAPEGSMTYYYKLHEITSGALTQEEIAEDQIREAENPDLPLNRELLSDFARAVAAKEREIFRLHEAKYSGQSDDFFEHLGQYAIENGYISAEQGERERREALAGAEMSARQGQGASL